MPHCPKTGEQNRYRHRHDGKHRRALAEQDDKHDSRVIFEKRREQYETITDNPRRQSAFGQQTGRQRQ